MKGGADGEEMNDTEEIFSFCFPQDEFVKKFQIGFKRLHRGRNNVRE